MRATARGAVATACPAANAITARQPPWHCLVFLHGPVMAASYPAPHSAPKSCEHMDHPAVLSTGTGTRGGNDNGGGIPVVNFDVLVNGTAINGHRPSGTLAGRARIGASSWYTSPIPVSYAMHKYSSCLRTLLYTFRSGTNVINHGVPEDLKEAMVEACKELVAKLERRCTSRPSRWLPYASDQASTPLSTAPGTSGTT
jgi:hypothetical protein